MLPPLKVIRAGLHCATEALATELANPGHATPDWNDLEWKLAMAAAAVHGVSPLLCRRSRWDHPGWSRFLGEQRDHVAHRHRRIEALLDEIDAGARASGIAIVPLKGAALHALGIYAPGERPMADIDLLVTEQDAGAAARLLQDIGYVSSFDHWRHRSFKPATGEPPDVLGEHSDTPVNIDLHTRIRERLPVALIDVTGQIYPRSPEPGLNPYPSDGALMSHLLLHAAGNHCGRTLRLLHLHDIALLAQRMAPDEWVTLWTGGVPWWSLPPLRMVMRYYANAIPAAVLESIEPDCPPWLRTISQHQALTQVSCSGLWLQMLPGIEWCRTVGEAVRCVRSRITPSQEKIKERNDIVQAHFWLQNQSWSTSPRWRWLLTRLTHRVPRIDTMFAVRAALDPARLALCDDISSPSAARRPDAKNSRNDTAEVRLAATSSPPQS